MRSITLLLFIVPSLVWSQDCSESSPVDYSGFGPQLTEADYFADANSLDELNNSADWSLGTGISDNNLTIWSNADIHTFLGVKLRYTVAPNDNVISAGNHYFVEPGYSLASQNGPVGTGPEANWNILMYAGLDEGAFDSVDVVMHIDFDPCFSYVEEDMYSINIGSAFELNDPTNSAGFSSFGINTNLGAAEIANLNPNSSGFDANAEGYYTFAIEVLDNCGTRRLWNEITVYVQGTSTEEGQAVADMNGNGVYDDNEFEGCMSHQACNFSCSATTDDGSCESISCSGCTLETACNYDSLATLSNNITCTYIPAGWDDCDATICTDSDNDGNCDFDESAGCLGEFVAPHILLSGMLELSAPVSDWATNDYSTSTSDATGVEGITWMDYAGRLNDGRYSVTRIYTATDVCGNTSEAGQLLIADGNSFAGCTNASATNYNAAAVNDDGLCDYSPACLGDLNLDSIIGTSDLLILLSSFGLPCSE